MSRAKKTPAGFGSCSKDELRELHAVKHEVSVAAAAADEAISHARAKAAKLSGTVARILQAHQVPADWAITDDGRFEKQAAPAAPATRGKQ